MVSLVAEYGETVDRDLVDRIVARAELPDGHLLLLAGTPDLDDHGGACIPRFLLPLTDSGPFTRRCRSQWQVGISVSPRMCRLGLSRPAFFAQILAHELSDARLVLTDPEVHVYCAFLDRAVPEASAGRITQWHELPHEKAHDASNFLLELRQTRAKSLPGVPIAATDIELLMRRCPLRACAPVGVPLIFRSDAERD